MNHVTALISEQFTKSLLDEYPCAKYGKHILQKADAVLDPPQFHVVGFQYVKGPSSF